MERRILCSVICLDIDIITVYRDEIWNGYINCAVCFVCMVYNGNQ